MLSCHYVPASTCSGAHHRPDDRWHVADAQGQVLGLNTVIGHQHAMLQQASPAVRRRGRSGSSRVADEGLRRVLAKEAGKWLCLWCRPPPTERPSSSGTRRRSHPPSPSWLSTSPPKPRIHLARRSDAPQRIALLDRTSDHHAAVRIRRGGDIARELWQLQCVAGSSDLCRRSLPLIANEAHQKHEPKARLRGAERPAHAPRRRAGNSRLRHQDKRSQRPLAKK